MAEGVIFTNLQALARKFGTDAAAVCFKGEVKGDYMQLGNKRYVICDATYIGAGVGEAMPDLKRTPAQVVRID